MKYPLCLLALSVSLCSTFASPGGSEWVARPPEPNWHTEAKSLNREDFYEVSASKETVAVLDLEPKSIISLTEEQARWWTGHYYKCEQGKKPYLVRALYGQGGTGAYSLFRLGSALVVSHGSLGDPAMNRSALIVNLDFEPMEVYVIRKTIR